MDYLFNYFAGFSQETFNYIKTPDADKPPPTELAKKFINPNNIMPTPLNPNTLKDWEKEGEDLLAVLLKYAMIAGGILLVAAIGIRYIDKRL